MKSAIKSGTEVTLNLSSNVIVMMNIIFHISYYWLIHKFQSFVKLFATNSSANIKLSKTQLYKIGQSGGFSGRLLRPLLKSGLPLMKNILKPLAKNILMPLGLMAAALATDMAIYKMFGSGFTTLIIFNEEMEDIMEIVKSPEDSGLLIKGVSKTIKNEAK